MNTSQQMLDANQNATDSILKYRIYTALRYFNWWAVRKCRFVGGCRWPELSGEPYALKCARAVRGGEAEK